MARPLKKGLDYFPLDIDIFEDDKLLEIQNEYGPLGEVVYLRLLCLIYKNGYYYKFESIEKLSALLIKSVGKYWARGKDCVPQVISQLGEAHLFNLELMRSGILTSVGVQRRYLKAVGRRKRTGEKKDYWLLTENQENELFSELDEADSFKTALKNWVSADNNEVTVYNNADSDVKKSTKQTKTNKNKAEQNKSNSNKSESESKEKLNDSKETLFDSVHSVDIIDNPTETIANIYFKSKGKNQRLCFTNQDSMDFRSVFPDIDIKIEAVKMQKWFDKKANTNLEGESLQNFIIRWLATVQSQGGSKPVKENENESEEFDKDEFFDKMAGYESEAKK